MKILLTGERGIGKSTILQKVGDSFKGDLYGILSKEIRDKKGERVGFKAVNPDKESKVFAHRFNIQSKFVLNNKYKIDVKVIDSFVIP